MEFEEKTISRKQIFKGRIIDVNVDEVELPNGLGTSQRELVFHPGGVSVLALTAEGKAIMVRQYRKPAEKPLFEIPAGKLEAGEIDKLEEAVFRELEEETGYTADKLEKVAEFYVSPGFTNEKNYLFYAPNLRKVENPRPADADEVIELHELSLDQAKARVKSGEIEDAKTIIAIQYWELLTFRGAEKNEWHFGR